MVRLLKKVQLASIIFVSKDTNSLCTIEYTDFKKVSIVKQIKDMPLKNKVLLSTIIVGMHRL